jgi:hypothetical protein
MTHHASVEVLVALIFLAVDEVEVTAK